MTLCQGPFFSLIQLGKYSVRSFIKLAKSAKCSPCHKHFLNKIVSMSVTLNYTWTGLDYLNPDSLVSHCAAVVSCQIASHIPQLSRQLNLLILYTGALQIENSEESDQGKYECVAMNSAGTRYSSPANLYVRGKVKCLSNHHFCFLCS